MSNMLTEYQAEVRSWSDEQLAHALDHLNNSRDHKRLYTGIQKKDIRDEASRRLRWGRKAEQATQDFRVAVTLTVEAGDPDQAKDNAEAVLNLGIEAPCGVHYSFVIHEVEQP